YAWSHEASIRVADGNLVLLALACSCACLGATLSSRVPTCLASALPVAASAAAIGVAYFWLGYREAIVFAAVPAVLAAFLLHPLWAVVISAAATTVMTLRLDTAPELLWHSRLLVLFLGSLAAIVAHDWRRSLDNAWHYADLGASLTREVRARQEVVNRLNKALATSNGLLKRSLEELARAQREMAEARHLKEQFATTVSHELRTPLSIILGFLDVMQHYPEVYGDVNWTPRLRRDLGEIQHSARYLAHLVDDILDLARIQALKMPIHREQTDLRRLVVEVVELASRLLLDKPSVRINCSVPDGLPSLYLDHVRIRQVLLNLLANACRFTTQGEIKVKVAQSPEGVTVAVADTGPGIPQEQLQTIFEEFRQASSPALDEQASAGKGLGLAIAKHFVHMHGGRIWVESQSDPTRGPTGSTFYFTLPLIDKQVVSLPAPPLLASTASQAQPVVVLVDQADGQKLLARHLDGYQVVAAPDMAEARRLVRRLHPDAIIVNVPPESEGATQGMAPPILPEPVPLLQCSLPVGRWFLEPELFEEWLTKPLDATKLLEVIARPINPGSVLVVDDDRSFVRLLKRLLEARFRDCEILTAYSSEEALAVLHKQPVDVALLDIGLPGTDGRSLARAVRESGFGKEIRLIAVSGLQPGLEGSSASPQSFAITSSRGFSEGDTLGLIRACLSLLRPAYASEVPAREPEVEPSAQPAL
ncbi:MAG: ATP-binding protein, partial [Anaerolineae bacterium]